MLVTAVRINRPLHASLVAPDPRPSAPGRVLGAFERACDLWLEPYGVVAVVTATVGDGPFNIVLADDGAALARVQPDHLVRLTDGRLAIGDLVVDLRPATVWEPSPDWPTLRRRLPFIRPALDRLRQEVDPRRSPLLALALGNDPRRPLPTSVRQAAPATQPGRELGPPSPPPWAPLLGNHLAGPLGQAAPAIRAGWGGDDEALAAAAARLAGLGPGLTPAGDDFLLGLLIWAWLSHPDPPAFGRTVCAAATPRTTLLSAAWLNAAAAGQLAAIWHRLLASLAACPPSAELRPALHAILAHGATSGADALAGLLWLTNA